MIITNDSEDLSESAFDLLKKKEEKEKELYKDLDKCYIGCKNESFFYKSVKVISYYKIYNSEVFNEDLYRSIDELSARNFYEILINKSKNKKVLNDINIIERKRSSNLFNMILSKNSFLFLNSINYVKISSVEDIIHNDEIKIVCEDIYSGKSKEIINNSVIGKNIRHRKECEEWAMLILKSFDISVSDKESIWNVWNNNLKKNDIKYKEYKDKDLIKELIDIFDNLSRKLKDQYLHDYAHNKGASTPINLNKEKEKYNEIFSLMYVLRDISWQLIKLGNKNKN